MPASSVVVQFEHYRDSPARTAAPHPLSAALVESLALVPPRPPGLAACVAHLQQDAQAIAASYGTVRTLLRLRDTMFVAPGRDAQMNSLWSACVATAILAARLARALGLEPGLAAGAGLLHRAGDVWALAALARAEIAIGSQLPDHSALPAVTAREVDLAARLASCWALSPEMTSAMTHWRQWPEEAGNAAPSIAGVVYFACLLATELAWPETCTPGALDAAAADGGVEPALLEDARTQFPALRELLARL